MSGTNPSGTSPSAAAGTLADENLDGHTVEELSAYLDARREPRNPHIEESPGCQLALESLERLRRLSPALLDHAEDSEAPPDEGWLTGILGLIARDARAGRRVPLRAEDSDVAITEGALRGVIRSSEAAVPGALLGRARITGDLEKLGADVAISVDVALPYGEPLRDAADALRDEIRSRVARHAELNLTRVDVVVHDIRDLAARDAVQPTLDESGQE